MPGPPFAFGAILVILALIVALFIPENPHSHVKSPTSRRVAPPLLQCDEDLAETSMCVCAHGAPEKSKPVYCCDNFVYCQPICVIFGT